MSFPVSDCVRLHLPSMIEGGRFEVWRIYYKSVHSNSHGFAY